MRFIDANIFLRFLTRDDERKAEACLRFFQGLSAGKESATTSESVIAEIVYVLGSRAHYGLAADEIRGRLRPLLMAKGLNIPRKQVILRGLDYYATYPFLDFEDALTIGHVQLQRLDSVLSYDKDFDRVPDVIREEP